MFKQGAGRKQGGGMLNCSTCHYSNTKARNMKYHTYAWASHAAILPYENKFHLLYFCYIIFQPTFGFHIYPSPKGIHGHEHFGNTRSNQTNLKSCCAAPLLSGSCDITEPTFNEQYRHTHVPHQSQIINATVSIQYFLIYILNTYSPNFPASHLTHQKLFVTQSTAQTKHVHNNFFYRLKYAPLHFSYETPQKLWSSTYSTANLHTI